MAVLQRKTQIWALYRLILKLNICLLVVTSVQASDTISRDDLRPVEEIPLDEAVAGLGAEDPADYDEADDRMDYVTPDPSTLRHWAPSRRHSPEQPKKRILTNTKLFYFLPSPSREPKPVQPAESRRRAASEHVSDRSDFGYESYGGGGGGASYGYPSGGKEPSYKAIHIHSAAPVQYHGGDKKKDEHFWPLLLLSFLPLLFGGLILLPLILSFFTQILQLLALMQNTLTNINTSTTTTTAATVLLGRRRRRHISSLEVELYPNGVDEMVDLLNRRLSKALLRFDSLKSASS